MLFFLQEGFVFFAPFFILCFFLCPERFFLFVLGCQFLFFLLSSFFFCKKALFFFRFLFFRQTDSFRFCKARSAVGRYGSHGFFSIRIHDGFCASGFLQIIQGLGASLRLLPSPGDICLRSGQTNPDQPDNNEHHRAHEFIQPALL